MRCSLLTFTVAPLSLVFLALVAARSGEPAFARVAPSTSASAESKAAQTKAAQSKPSDTKSAELPALVSPTELVSAQRGTLPIVIAAPHGGGAPIPGVERRTGPQDEKARADFATEQDVRTAELAWIVAQRLTTELGAKPYVVVAQFHRRYADANRSAEDGTECEAARREHAAYHRALRTCVDEVRARFGSALLVDLHGQSKEPDAIVRGTRNGRSVKLLVARAGVPAITSNDGLFGFLESRGVRVLPANLAQPGELVKETLFAGGHTLALYGSDTELGIDAVQIEVGSTLREPDALWQTGDTLADAIAQFARAQLGVAPVKR